MHSLQHDNNYREHSLDQAILAVDFSPVAALLTNNKGIICHANQAMASLLETSQKHLNAGRPLVAFVPFGQQYRFFKTFRLLSPETSSLSLKEPMVFRSANGSQIICRVSIALKSFADDHQRYILWMFQDASEEFIAKAERDRLQIALQIGYEQVHNLTKQAEHKIDGLNKMSSQFMHELKAPLQAIIVATEMMLDKERSDEHEKLTQVLHASALSLQNLVNGGLSLSRDTLKKLEIHNSEIDLNEFIQNIFLQFGVQAQLRQITLSCSVQLDKLFVCDQLLLSQILSNLISNALKHTPDKGSVEVEVMQFNGADRLLFTVTDSGSGINEALIDHVFEPFSDACTYDTQLRGGTGFGLYTCKFLLEKMSGHISIENVPAGGCKVLFTLPYSPDKKIAKQNEDRQNEQEDKQNNDHVKSIKVLVAEDNALVAEVMSLQLTRLGCQVQRAENGEKAVLAANRDQFDLIFMDCQMPVQDGYWAANQIRQLNDSYKAVPIVALTGSSDPDEEKRCKQAGMNKVLRKPANTATIKQILMSTSAPA
jgi:signal transduction histidine kinase/CheY-like chemotaxis protein